MFILITNKGKNANNIRGFASLRPKSRFQIPFFLKVDFSVPNATPNRKMTDNDMAPVLTLVSSNPKEIFEIKLKNLMGLFFCLTIVKKITLKPRKAKDILPFIDKKRARVGTTISSTLLADNVFPTIS